MDRTKLAQEILYERACDKVKLWFRAYEKGLEPLLTAKAVEDLLERVKLRDELQAELYPAPPADEGES